MSLSDSRRGPVYLSRATGLTAQNAATTTVLSCCVIVPLVACQSHYPGGTDQARLRSAWSAAAFPMPVVGRLPRQTFSGPARQFTRVLARRLAELLKQSLDAKGFRPVSTLPIDLGCFLVYNLLQVWVLHPREQSHLSTTHTGDVRDRPPLEWVETQSLASRERQRPEGSSRLRSWLAST